MKPSAMINPPLSPVLIIEGLSTLLTLNRGRTTVPLVEHFDLRVYPGERWAIVG